MNLCVSRDNGEWKKVLYLKQDVPDHYVPPSFLKDLRENYNVQHYQLKDAILAAGALTEQISSIIIFIVVFVYLDSGHNTVLSIGVCMAIAFITLFLYFTLIFLSPSNDVMNELKSAVIFLISGFAVSPILKTLTETISTDTIYAMVTIMMLVHLTFYNYGAKAAIVSTPVALNAAIFGAVCLASRLSTTYHAFALLIFASDIFVLSSILRQRMRDYSSDLYQAILTLFFACASITFLSTIVPFMYSFLFFTLLICINFFFPLGFYQCQTYKRNIYGPWDEAIIETPIYDGDHHDDTFSLSKR